MGCAWFRALTPRARLSISLPIGGERRLAAVVFFAPPQPSAWRPQGALHHNGTLMANTKSAKKATRKIARRTEINKARRSRMRGTVRTVEEAIAGGDRTQALAALKAAEPELMRAAQRGVIHKKTASRKVSRLTAQIGKLGK
jgi:small subunit ribosomal protein S20